MNCVELRHSLAEIEDGGGTEQRAHLRDCPNCSALVSELNLIISAAPELRESDEPSPRVWNSIEIALRQMDSELDLIIASAPELRECDEPSPRVWNSIEIALRQEGMIRPQNQPHRAGRSLLPSFNTRWAWARWLAPIAALLLITAGIYVRQNSLSAHLGKDAQIATAQTTAKLQPASDVAVAGLNDNDLLQEVADQTPKMQQEYTDNLRRVNEYIHDAQSDVDANPNDEEARRSLMAAYQEKAMLFEMAMDRSLP